MAHLIMIYDFVNHLKGNWYFSKLIYYVKIKICIYKKNLSLNHIAKWKLQTDTSKSNTVAASIAPCCLASLKFIELKI